MLKTNINANLCKNSEKIEKNISLGSLFKGFIKNVKQKQMNINGNDDGGSTLTIFNIHIRKR